MGGERPVLRATAATARMMALTGALLLIPAGLVLGGTWIWPQGLLLVAVHGAVFGTGDVLLAFYRRAHFEVRQQPVVAAPEKRQPRLDAVGAAGLLAMGAAWLVFIPLDVFSLHLLPRPAPWLSISGLVAVGVGAALTPLAVWENRFATPNVQQQPGQIIVRSGVYGVIRHPIYLGNLLLTAGTSLWLGSSAGLWGFAVLLAATIGRIWIEERDLNARVPDYPAYARQVRARLIPFVL
jgi:protein-S-isoprenylcysteine O-methyltransferase Ste14